MRFDLTSGTDAGLHALFDPGAVEPLPGNYSMRQWEDWVRGHEEAGRFLTYDEGGDGEAKLKLVVDEPFDEPGQNREDLVTGAVLRVPTGKLYFGGIEYVFWNGGPGPRFDLLDPPAEVAAGAYTVDGVHVDWDVSAERAEAEREAILQPGDRRYAGFFNGCAAPLGVALMFATGLAAVATMFLPRPAVWKLYVAVLALGAVAAVAAVLWLLGRSTRMSRWDRADEAMWKRYPHLVVVLRKLPDDSVPAEFTPARMVATARDAEPTG